MDRREFLSLGSLAALLPSVPARAASVQAGGSAGDAQLNATFDKIFEEQVRASPTFATSLGLDKGANADLKSKLDTRPYRAARAEDLARASGKTSRTRSSRPTSLATIRAAEPSVDFSAAFSWERTIRFIRSS